MQLSQPRTDSGGEFGIGREGILVIPVILPGDGDLLDRAVEEVLRPGPTIALVAHEALRQHEGMRRAVRRHAHNLAE